MSNEIILAQAAQNLTDHSKQAVNGGSALTPTAADISMPQMRDGLLF
jgi:hypothetical protein